MNNPIAHRLAKINPSPTLVITNRAAELRAAGEDVIGLGAGEPDFDTPDHIKTAAIAALKAGQTKYTAVDGTPELKTAIINKFAQDNQLTYTLKQILVSCGGKQSGYNLCQALINPGDEVIIPAPYWVSYPEMVRLAEGVPVVISATQEQDFKITAEQLQAAITPKTKLVFLNSPSNPTGKAYRRRELLELAEVLLKHEQVWIATDDMYEHILWADEPFSNILNACPELYDRTFVLNGVSKAYSMTGWRIGYAGGPEAIISTMKKIQSHSTSNPTSIAQAAACAALSDSQECVRQMVQAFKQRHDQAVAALNKLPGFECTTADGTFYLFPQVTAAFAAIPNINNDVDFAEFLLQQAKVALVPGSAFGAPGHVRISFATDIDTLMKAIERIGQVLQK